ncbi:hypothetical protein BH09VER1_BH09VER1_11130 [soil metagenome]
MILNAIARWFSEDPRGSDPMIRERMERLDADPMAQEDYGKPPSNVSSVMQVGFFETLWWLPNNEITIPEVANLEYLESKADDLRRWVGQEAYESVMLKIGSASGS